MKEKLFSLPIFVISILGFQTLYSQSYMLEDKWVDCNKSNCKLLDPYYSEGSTITWDGAEKGKSLGPPVIYICKPNTKSNNIVTDTLPKYRSRADLSKWKEIKEAVPMIPKNLEVISYKMLWQVKSKGDYISVEGKNLTNEVKDALKNMPPKCLVYFDFILKSANGMVGVSSYKIIFID